MSKDVFREMAKLKEGGQSGALATVVARKGSAPMSGDAKMLVREDGSTEGTVGGGCLEAEVWETAMSVLETGEPEKLRFDLTQQEAEDSGHICGGVVEILVEPFRAFQEELLDEINRIRTEGGSAALATIVQPGDIEAPNAESRKMLFRRDGSAVGEIPDYSTEIWAESTQIIRNGSPTLLQFNTDAARTGGKRPTLEGATEIFVEPISGQPLVYIFGGGHVSFCVAQAAYLAGFRVSIVEDRPSFANKERFPMAESFFVGEFPEIFEKIPVDESDYLAIITRGHSNDEVVLEWAMKTPARYIG
ncbi:MAG: XdhC family protein, partial [Nitrospinae bacterium]|nr:XdhC family protein [Nitrospinota bacterium]